MQITLPPEAQAIVERKLATGEFENETDVIVWALQSLELEDDIPRVPRELIENALVQTERGEVLPWTDDLRAEIRRDAIAKMQSGIPVSDDIKY